MKLDLHDHAYCGFSFLVCEWIVDKLWQQQAWTLDNIPPSTDSELLGFVGGQLQVTPCLVASQLEDVDGQMLMFKASTACVHG